jgi:iron complex outermembrane receptor protein
VQGTTVTARAFVDGYWYRGDYEYEDTSSGTPVRYLNKDETVGGEAGTEVKGIQELFSKRVLLTLGAEYRRSFKQHQENYDDVDPRVVYLDSEETDHTEGAYAQVDGDLGSGFRFNGGVRCDHYHTFGSTTNPRAGLLWSPNGSTAVKVLGGTAYRAPSAYELHYVTQGGTLKAGPEPLDPETIATYEASVEHEFGKGIRGVLTGFIYDVDDVITLEADPADGLLYLSNSGEVKGTGVEAELQLRFDNGTLGRFSYSYQEAKETDGDHWLPNSPRNLAQASFSYPLLAEKLFAGLEFQYVGERRNLAGEIVDDYAVVNLTLHARELFRGMEFSATVRNLLGAKYADPGAAEHAQGEIEQDGMTFQLKLTWKF